MHRDLAVLLQLVQNGLLSISPLGDSCWAAGLSCGVSVDGLVERLEMEAVFWSAV